MKVLKVVSKIIFWFILSIIALYSIVIIAQKIIWHDETPSFFGYKNFIVLTNSMVPALNAGDIVFVKESNDIKVNDIISFKIDNSVVTHRVTEVVSLDGEDGYITKGDANNSIDTEIQRLSDIEGKYAFKIPYLGKLILFLKKPIGLILLLLVFGIALFINSILEKK